MKKRIAYIGLSYPLLYDYENQAILSNNDLSDSPNPIIESPLGLMILYDELWFLCESVCPNNMRNLSYVKFVDKMFPELYYEGAVLYEGNTIFDIDENMGLSYEKIINRMNLKGWNRVDTHTHQLQIGNVFTYGNGGKSNFKFDLYIFMALQEQSADSIELVSNSRFRMVECAKSNKDAEVAEKIVISDIPNYLNKQGPYHPCMEDLRNNQYLADFRKWIIENHNTIQNKEIKEICTDVERTIKDTRDKVFNKYLEDNNKYSFCVSTGTTILKTGMGILCTPISILDAIAGIRSSGKNVLKVNGDRWQGFVVNSRNKIDFKR